MSFSRPSNETPEEEFLRTLPFVLNPSLVRASNAFRDMMTANSYQRFIMLVMGFASPINHPMELSELHYLSVLLLIKLFAPLDNLDIHFQHIIDELEASMEVCQMCEIGKYQELLNFMFSLAQTEMAYSGVN
jgi:hypothetical protein